MPRTRPPYPREFREQLVALVHAGRTPEELSREFEPAAETIRKWVRQAAPHTAHETAPSDRLERSELARLRRENQQLRLERDILAKAAAWFARETDALPPKSSRS